MVALIANGTEVMRRLAIAHAFLQRVDGRRFKHRDQCVTISFSFPVFKLHNLFFKIVFFAQQRRILLLYGRDQGVRINECFLKLYELGVALCFVGSGGNVSAGFRKARDCSEESGEGIGHSSSNVEVSGLGPAWLCAQVRSAGLCLNRMGYKIRFEVPGAIHRFDEENTLE